MSNVILQNVFIQRLPTDLPKDLREYLQKSFDIPQSIDQGVERGIRLACEYMFGRTQGIRLIVCRHGGSQERIYPLRARGRSMFVALLLGQGASLVSSSRCYNTL